MDKLQEHEQEAGPSDRSLRGLSWMIFFLSDIRPGIGPFLSIYLKSYMNLNSGMIGIALGMTDLTAAICQIPSGLLVDSIKAKRFLMFMACLIVSFACAMMLVYPSFLMVIIGQGLIGISAAIIPPTIAAITLGLIGTKRFPKRISINETWSHMGNVATAAVVGLSGYLLGLPWILYLVIIFAAASAFSLSFINPKEINHAVARELVVNGDQTIKEPMPVKQLFKESYLLIFCFSVFLFHFCNAAQLPLIGQFLSLKDPAISSIFMGTCIILAQVVMIVVAYSLGFVMNSVGRKPLFLIALGILPIRAFLYTLTDDVVLLTSVQLLDGIGAGIFGVIGIVTISDIAKGTGRFNFSVGLMTLAQGVGASLSNFLSGYVVNTFSFDTGFFVLSGIGIIGFCFYAALMPETKKRA